MPIFQSSLYAIACIFCLFFAFLHHRINHPIRSTFFVAYLLLEALCFFLEWVLLYPNLINKGFLLGIMMVTSLLLAPCLWLFALNNTQKKQATLKHMTPGQWLTIIVGWLLLMPLMSTVIDGTLMTGMAFSKQSEDVIIHTGMLLSIGIYLFQSLFYLQKTLKIFNNETQKNKALFSNIDDMPLNIVRCLIWVLVVQWVSSLSRTLLIWLSDGYSIFYTLLTLSEVAVIIWALYQIFASRVPALTSEQNTTDQSKNIKNKYTNYVVDDELNYRIAQKISDAMEQKVLYKQSNLTLNQLCEIINEKPHYVSLVINKHLKSNFYELINRYRIEEAKKILTSNIEHKIIDIALDVGYNSKSTFNAAFKRYVNMTPSQYRK